MTGYLLGGLIVCSPFALLAYALVRAVAVSEDRTEEPGDDLPDGDTFIDARLLNSLRAVRGGCSELGPVFHSPANTNGGQRDVA